MALTKLVIKLLANLVTRGANCVNIQYLKQGGDIKLEAYIDMHMQIDVYTHKNTHISLLQENLQEIKGKSRLEMVHEPIYCHLRPSNHHVSP